MDLNKEFLSQVVLAVNKLFPKQNVNVKRITITDEGSGGALCVLLFIISLIVMACILTHEKKLHLASQPTSQPTRF